MYRLREEYIPLFKEMRTVTYSNYLKCEVSYASSIVNGSKWCTGIYAQAMISTRFDVSFRYIENNNLLEKYFAKEK